MSLDIVIVAYNCRALLDGCLGSLEEHPANVPTTIWVVDNGSSDGTLEMLRRHPAQVRLIEGEVNLGFSRANNLAIKAGSRKYVLALNPDTRATDGALDRMLEVMEMHPEVAIAGCDLRLEDGSFDHAARRAFPTPLSALGHFTGVGRRSGAPARLAAYRAPAVERGVVDAVNGAFMLIRRRALDEIGLFDEGYWMYMEDLDLCYRASRAGWKTWYEPSATFIHVKAGTSGTYRSLRLNCAFHYGMFRFYRKFYARNRSAVVNLAIYAAIGTKLAISATRSALGRRVRTFRATRSA